MEVNVQVICREIIKPSSPTPQHLKSVKVSYLDQIVTNHYIPHIIFFQAHKSKGLTITQISQQLKRSLSNILTSFYPLAGRAQADDLAIDCNDAGVEFVTARTHAHLSDVIKDPDMEDLKKYIPIDPVEPEERPLFNVQITFFDCGGIALGVYYSHIIIDCYSLLMFLNAWASICRGEPEIVQPVNFDLANYFPAREFRSPIFAGREVMSKEKLEKCSVKKFVFNKEIIAHLKSNVATSSGSRVKDPTQVEVVTAFILKYFLEAANPNSSKTFLASHVVNLRGKNSLPHSLRNTIGNCIIPCFAYVQVSSELHELVSKLRSSIRRIDGDYIREIQIGNGFVDELTSLQAKSDELEMCTFSSWCRLPVYEMDYGFGTPIWYCTASLPTPNSAVFISTKSGDDIEAWINMEQATLEMLAAKITLIL